MPAGRIVGRLIAYVEGVREHEPNAFGCGRDLETQQVPAPIQDQQPGSAGNEYLPGLRRPISRLTAFRLRQWHLANDIEVAVGSIGRPAAYLVRACECRPHSLSRMVKGPRHSQHPAVLAA